jgi:hypothetical protein
MSIQPGSVQRINTPTRRDVLKATMGVMNATLWGGSPAYAEEERMTTTTKSYALPSVLTYDDVRAVSPALEHYTKGALLDGLWQRPETMLPGWANVDVRAVGITVLEQRKPVEDRRGRDAVESRKHSTLTQDTDIVEWCLDGSEHSGNSGLGLVHRCLLPDAFWLMRGAGEGKAPAARL